MLSLSITDIKSFMGKLLKEDTFDTFNLHSLTIQNFAHFEIHKPEDQPPPKWSVIRPFALDMVRGGGATPKTLKTVLSTDGSLVNTTDTTLFLNTHFEEGNITITTGISQKTFTMDKSPQIAWDNYIQNFLNDKGIGFTNNLEG